MVTLSIIILSFNAKELTKSCILSLVKQYKKQLEEGVFEIIIVDNASTDGSYDALQEQFGKEKNIHCFKNEENLGFSKGCNTGALHAKGEFLLFLNSDTTVTDTGFLSIPEVFSQHEKVGAVGLRIVSTDGSTEASAGKFYSLLYTLLMLIAGERLQTVRFAPQQKQQVDWVSGAAIVVPKKVFTEVGGFDEHIFMYTEDMEFCYRLHKRGYSVYYAPVATVTHVAHGSSNRTFAIINIYKGLLYFYRVHKPHWQYILVRLLLQLKALVLVFLGKVTHNEYITQTYAKALTVFR